MKHIITRFLCILSMTVSLLSCNQKGNNNTVGKDEVPAHNYAILNPTARVSKIFWNEKLEYDDSLSYKAMQMMINSFEKSRNLKGSKIYWSSSADYAVAANTLWQNAYYGNSITVPNSFLEELSGLKEQYVLLVKFTGAVRHWTNIVTRGLSRLLNEISFGFFGLDEDDMLLEAAPDVNMKVLAIDRASKKIIYKGDLDLIFKSPVDSTTFSVYSQYFF